ncbi:MAG: ABC transporter ATP-binding protein [Desulfonauticus sp.]|nr:ABC transporter ATP-binding protein [Desulfonauticus sp.]
MVILKNVYKSYKTGEVVTEVIKGLNLEIKQGEFVAIIGPSGSGKSTILNMIGGLDTPSKGDIFVDNQDIAKLSDAELSKFRAKKLGFIFQDFNLIPVFTVRENIKFVLDVIKHSNEDIEHLLQEIGILEHIDKFPDQLSGGQKQRVAVARALVGKPKLILADEPTANLDSKSAQKVIEIMKKMQKEFNTTFIFSTHDTRLTSEVSRILELEDGKIVRDIKK